MKNISFFLLFFILNSCSFFTSRFESLTTNKKSKVSYPVIKAKNNSCDESNKIQYVSEDETSLPFYRQLGPNLFEGKFHFIQKAIMLSLIEMSRRPDKASPYSRFQVFFQYNKKKYYFDFSQKAKGLKMPYLKGLETLTQNFLPGQTLLSLAANLDNIVPQDLNVSINFENFLRENKNQLIKNDLLTEHFFKGDEILTKYETFKRISYKNIITHYMTPSYSQSSDYDFGVNGLETYQSVKENFKTRCNININHPSPTKEENSLNEKLSSHYIGFKEGDNFFLAMSSNKISRPFITDKFSYFMHATASTTPLPVCEFKNQDQEIVLFSSDGRDPAQHLQHLVAYDISLVDSSSSLNELLNFSRHLFLANPDRILYESKRGKKSQLDFFLTMNFPIYHIESLGDLVGFASFQKNIDGKIKKEQNLHIDDRSHARLWCKP